MKSILLCCRKFGGFKEGRRQSQYQGSNKVLDRIMLFQKTAGNRSVENLIRSKGLQAKVRIGRPGDEYEQEADRVADQVMRMSEPMSATINDIHLQKAFKAGEENELKRQPVDYEEEKMRRQPEEEEDKIQAKMEGTDSIIEKTEHQIQRLVSDNRVSCRNLPRTYPIFTAMRTNDPVGEIRAADTRAIEILNNVINELTNIRARVRVGETPAYPLIADAVGLGLRNRLRLNANNRAVWTGTGPGTVEIIIRWYSNVRSLLRSGFISYSCIGRDCGTGDWAYVFEGTRRINLCRNFWNASNDNRALTLIHETAHLFYGLEDAGGGAGNASCLEQYAADANGIDILPEFIAICRPPPP